MIDNISKFLSRTWIATVFAMTIFALGTIVFFICILFLTDKDLSWYIPLSGFCSGIIGLFVGLEKLIDRTRIQNGNTKKILE